MAVKRMVILVEGDSELAFIKRMLIPQLYARSEAKGISGWSIETCKIISNRKLQKKGGNINYEYLYNDIERFTSQGCSVLTTFLDFFRLPNDFPGYTINGNQIHLVESAMKHDLKEKIPHLPCFVPYIQKYEFEALLFSNMNGFNYLIDDAKILEALNKITEQYTNPEDINGGQDTAPSKRLMALFNYNKTADSIEMLKKIGFDTIYARCPRFSNWFDCLCSLIID